jgi:hypothetical protein
LNTLRKRFASSLRFGAGEQVVMHLLDFGVLAVLLCALSLEEIAIFGVVTGVSLLFALFSLSPESITMRSYLAWQRDGCTRESIEALQWFAVGRLVLMTAVGGAVAAVLGMSASFAGYAVVYVAGLQLNNLAEVGRRVFRVKLQQRKILWVDGTLKSLFLVSTGVLFYSPCFATYLALYLGFGIVSAVVWNCLVGRETGARFAFDRRYFAFLRECLREFSVWHHLSWIATSTIYNIDPWIMSVLGVDATTVGTYTVALKICNRLFLAALFVQSMTTILLVNASDRSTWPNLLSRVLGMNGLFALAQWLAFLVFGKLLIGLLGGSGAIDQIYRYAVLVSTGVMVLSCSMPFVGYFIAAANLRQVFLRTYLPVCLAALLIYPVFISWWGAWGAAWASLASYSLLAAAFALFVRSEGLRLPMPQPDLRFLADVVRSRCDIRAEKP